MFHLVIRLAKQRLRMCRNLITVTMSTNTHIRVSHFDFVYRYSVREKAPQTGFQSKLIDDLRVYDANDRITNSDFSRFGQNR